MSLIEGEYVVRSKKSSQKAKDN